MMARQNDGKNPENGPHGFDPNPIFSYHFALNHFADLFSVPSVASKMLTLQNGQRFRYCAN
jgi:hypothetical protein